MLPPSAGLPSPCSRSTCYEEPELDYSTLDDVELIGLIVRSEPAALSQLYDRYSRLVFSIAYSLVGDYATTEEITQDVFIRVWERASQYRADQGKVSTWLISIARHRSIDMLRRQGARPEDHTVSWAESTIDGMPSDDDPQEAAELSMQRQRVRAAIAQLPIDQKEALALAYFNGYTHRQIAERLEQPLGTVKTRIRLAMQKLRQLLKDEKMVP
jgi:RNA polymerase sigma-70 factor, ECF subfamily